MIRVITLFLATMFAVMPLAANDDAIALLVNFDGMVKKLKPGAIKKESIRAGEKIFQGDLLMSYSKSHALVVLRDGSKIVLDEDSVLHFASSSVEQKSGRIYYNIQKRRAHHALQVKTNFAIIGIKGTTFIVNSKADNKSIALKEGLIGVESIKEAFALYRKKELAEFEAFKRKQNEEFEAYKNEGNEYTKTITKAFELRAGKSVRFDGNSAKEDAMKEQNKKSFDYFARLAKSLL